MSVIDLTKMELKDGMPLAVGIAREPLQVGQELIAVDRAGQRGAVLVMGVIVVTPDGDKLLDAAKPGQTVKLLLRQKRGGTCDLPTVTALEHPAAAKA